MTSSRQIWQRGRTCSFHRRHCALSAMLMPTRRERRRAPAFGENQHAGVSSADIPRTRPNMLKSTCFLLLPTFSCSIDPDSDLFMTYRPSYKQPGAVSCLQTCPRDVPSRGWGSGGGGAAFFQACQRLAHCSAHSRCRRHRSCSPVSVLLALMSACPWEGPHELRRIIFCSSGSGAAALQSSRAPQRRQA